MPEHPSDDAPFGESYGPLLQGPYAPISDELVLDALEVEGEVPADLNGVYLRNGPNPRFAPQGRYHPFDGDGMIHSAHFDRGRVTYRNRWVRTDAFLEEEREGRALYWGIRDTLKGRSDRRLKDSANTDVVVHGGKALASWYMSGALHMLDPVTLLPSGKAAYSGPGGKNVSAHCKVDPRTGELLFFDYDVTPPFMSYGVAGREGNLKHHVAIDLPGPRLPHDMAITRSFTILHDLPLFHDEDALRSGRHKLVFHPEMTTRFGVIPRMGSGSDIRWFEFSPCFVYHTINAWEEGDEITMVGCRFMPVLTAGGDIDARRTAQLVAELGMTARLWRWRMNLRTGATLEGPLDEQHNVEFPSVRGELLGSRSRYAYMVDHHPSMLRWTGIRKFDTDTGACLGAWSDGHEVSWYSEPWFAPKDKGQERERAEDGGYVIAFMWNTELRRQELQVFDARSLDKGPVARIRIPRRIPSGFHACWAGIEELM